MRLEFEQIVNDATEIIKDIEVFSFGQFEELFFNRPGSWDSVVPAMISFIRDLKSEGRFGYASSFESTLRAIVEYHEKKHFSFNSRVVVEERFKRYLACKKLHFRDITPTWLKNFEGWLKSTGRSKSTIGIYTRNLRVLFNVALKEKKVKAVYPFTKYKPKTADGRKIAISAHQISLIANYKTEHPQEIFYRDLFMFSFLGNGINFSDLCRLRYSNIDGNEIVFVREKTKGKAKEVSLSFHVTEHIDQIIKRHGNRAVGFDAYIFPVLTPDMNEAQQYAAVKQMVKQTNKYLRQIARKLKIQERLSTYVARHSWASIAQNSGTSTEYIKESLGHSSVSVTEAYLRGFEKSTKQKHSEKIDNTIYNNEAI